MVMAKTHKLKTWTKFYDAVEGGHKRFEIRKNDRGFQVGDTVVLQEWDKEDELYTGLEISGEISYITDFEQKPGYVVFGLRDVS
jgi:Domain of unknown function (DUF3850)